MTEILDTLVTGSRPLGLVLLICTCACIRPVWANWVQALRWATYPMGVMGCPDHHQPYVRSCTQKLLCRGALWMAACLLLSGSGLVVVTS